MSQLPSCFEDTTLTIVDVGARGGLDSRWKPFASVLSAVFVEPEPTEARRLLSTIKETGLKQAFVIPCALGSEPGRVQLNLANNSLCSSVLHPNLAFLRRFQDVERFETRTTVEMECDTLDEQLKQLGIAEIDFLKIDVEGYEAQVLEGAARSLPHCLGLEAEVSFQERYLGQTLFCGIHARAASVGLQLADLERKWWKRRDTPHKISSVGQIVFGDCLWLRDPALEELSREKLLKLVILMLVYRIYDWAHETMREAACRKLVTLSELDELTSWMAQRSVYRNRLWRWIADLPHFPFKRSLARSTGILSHLLQHKYYGESFLSDSTAWNRKWKWE